MNRSLDRVFARDATCAEHNTSFERMRHHSVTTSPAISIKLLILSYLTMVSRAGLELMPFVLTLLFPVSY
jgi:hypothetical protein